MSPVSDVIVALVFLALSSTVSGSVTQCYHCNSAFCGDTYDPKLGAISSCSDIFKNTQMFSNKLVSGVVGSEAVETLNNIGSNDTENIETLDSSGTVQTHAGFFDIQRKIWEFFNKGEIDENTQFVCVKTAYTSAEDKQTKTYRGCVPKYTKSIATACEFVNQKVAGVAPGTVQGCYTCETNLCNSGISLISSMFVMAAGVALKFIF